MDNKKYKSAIISSTVEICSVHPLDVYKVLYQKNNTYSFLNYLKESIQFKYRGFVYRFIGIIPMRTTFWISQYHGEQIYYNKIFKNKLYNKINNYTCISLYSSFFQTLIDAPIENFKIRRILNNKNNINNFIYFNNIYEEIYKYYYRGFIFNYLRNFIFVGFVYSFNKEFDNKFISGGLGGMLGSILSQPLDYIKTQKQSNLYNSYRDIIYDKNFIKNCMNGTIPRASMSFISMGIGSFVYFLI